ncbi:MAG: (Fe-S)-binding protein [Prolixibacteraceae bacterium]|jgi:Fe-S oxidoreductase|nr:(Fe-S)-binding protein [Prolixibacteraceae bacterium]
MRFDYFVVPFCFGFGYLIIILVFKYGRWIRELGEGTALRIFKSLLSRKTLQALSEIFLECLVHRKVFRINLLLGYMHMSLALGWFLLIVIGKFEASYFTGEFTNEFYFPIFFRFFELNPHRTFALQFFNALMDLLLLFILSGVALAIYKRFKSSAMGMNSSTRHTSGDKWALALLWMIFPLRLLAESLTAGFAGNGSFLTQPLGNLLGMIFPVRSLATPFWWGYSIVLGGFMVALPYSRYMHIPTEIFLILLKNWGFRPGESISGVVACELYSCSRCGICIDRCQMDPAINKKNQMVYFLRELRAGNEVTQMAHNCLLCGRCQEICPVGLDLTNLRMISRKPKGSFHINPSSSPSIPVHSSTNVLYFAGCMGSLTPGIGRSMEVILKESGENYLFLDKEKSYCCGRPLKLAGHMEEAEKISQNIKEAIVSSGAHTLVTSCPICYKSFKDDYRCNLRVLHHSEYLLEIIQSRLILIEPGNQRFVYHDPCELGRKSGIYNQPREILDLLGNITNVEEAYGKSMCCGGSVGHLSISMDEREQIQKSTSIYLNQNNPDCIATACPLCKKSLAKYSESQVKDIAELVAENMIQSNFKYHRTRKSNPAKVAGIVS